MCQFNVSRYIQTASALQGGRNARLKNFKGCKSNLKKVFLINFIKDPALIFQQVALNLYLRQ
jgi:hypothetical protein